MDLQKIAIKLFADIGAVAPFYGRIGGIGDMLLIDPTTEISESAYIVHAATTVTDNEGQSHVVQTLTENFSIFASISAARPTADRYGSGANVTIDLIREQLLDTLIGWIMDIDMYPIAYAGDNISDVNRAWIWWQYNFTAKRIITAKVYDDSALPDFNKAYVEYLAQNNVPPKTAPLPIEDTEYPVTFEATGNPAGDNLVIEDNTERVVGNKIVFKDIGGTLPAGLAYDTTYYVITVNTGYFQISDIVGGDPINLIDNGAGSNAYIIMPDFADEVTTA